ncbi:peptidoglycan-associated lipoprotein [Teredinibacter turnerae T7901]|uniref:Peptidoglycan-associated lipoprotein n=1 Tax=Teredinibacter turnerae (strain ATCC 39867 / T7901) TaxID=377629 RepID=C5BQS8_TERTT|nr:peptidoglycan-associated lipoprotein Pal [Teredinibacter turnerae]ACR12076.1 peptidoglycan-associated lipoprotein [Teredinibacter turnerae T7901]
MSNILKSLITLVAVFGLLAGCSSSTKKDETDSAANDSASTDTSAYEDTTETVDPYDALNGVATVFYFDFDQSILRADARSALMVYAEVLKAAPKSVRLEGHADERGTREYNMALGERRANAVRDFLILQGVDSSLIETVSYGEERPAQMGSSESSWAMNRRVEIVL